MQKMRIIYNYIVYSLCSLTMIASAAYGGDQCVFEVTADEMPPNVVFLLDNGAEMKHPAYHEKFDNSVDYTPAIGVDAQTDAVINGGNGNGFFNDNGYGIFQTGGSYYLAAVGADLVLETKTNLLKETGAKGAHSWTINGRTISLPAEASSTKDSAGIIDGAGFLRYSKNYLNWLFFLYCCS